MAREENAMFTIVKHDLLYDYYYYYNDYVLMNVDINIHDKFDNTINLTCFVFFLIILKS